MQDARGKMRDARSRNMGRRQIPTPEGTRFRFWGVDGLLLGIAVALFLALAGYQLGLPGLHYDEAKEAGNNALQLLRGLPVQPFRGAGLRLGDRLLPLMVQDYIGALNVYLAVPFLALFGISVPALRLLPLLTAATTLVLVYVLANEAFGRRAAAITVLLLAVNPSFVFWNRQGIFVTNVTATLAVASSLTALRWWRHRRPRDLYLTAFLWGLGIYAKLLFVWVIGATIGVLVISRLGRWVSKASKMRADPLASGLCRSSPISHLAPLAVPHMVLAALCFLLPLAPLILFNFRTGGTLVSIFSHLSSSYYGVQNAAFGANLVVRMRQLLTLLRGDHLWYLGGRFANGAAPWLAVSLIAASLLISLVRLLRQPHPLSLLPPASCLLPLASCLLPPASCLLPPASCLLPLAFCLLLVVQSCFTVSGLFITHYAILLSFVILAVAAAADWLLRRGGHLLFVLVLAALVWWGAGDLWVTVQYHRALTATGGHATHSDAIYHLAEYLDAHDYRSPLVLDWGIEAPLYFLTAGRVQPVEIFGYERLEAPDAGFAERLRPFLDDPSNVYLFHVPEETVFRGRREAFDRLVAAAGLVSRVEEAFYERSGHMLFVLARVEPR